MSFKYKFILSFVTIEIFFIVLIVATNFITLHNSTNKFTNERITSSSQLLISLIKSPISVYDIATLDNIIMDSKDISGLDSIIIQDSKNRTLASNYALNYPIENILNIKDSKNLSFQDKDMYVLHNKIEVNNTNIGFIYIIYDLTDFKQIVESNKNNTFFIILIEILISTFVSYILGAKLTKRLIKLTDAANKIANDEIAIIPSTDKKDELGILNNTMKKMQQDIMERNSLLNQSHSVFENIHDAIFVVNNKLLITSINKSFIDITGYSYDEVINKNFSFLFNILQEKKSIYKQIKKSLQKESFWNSELNGIKKNKELFSIRIRVSKITTNNTFYFIGAFTDISQEKEKEKIIQIQSKLATMGEMMNNVAHQWRQPLSAISAGASGLQLYKELGTLNDDKFNNSINKILEYSDYLSSTIDDFRNFFLKDKIISSFNIIDIINKEHFLFEGILKNKNIDFIINSEKVVMLNSFKNELLQALMNIVSNSKDALCVDDKKIDKCIIFDVSQTEDNVKIIIKDNAGGIEDSIINKVFEPYFTTKHQSQGTGIGLYMTHSIICNNMKGSIFVDNINFEYKDNTYKGACFTIILPKDIC